MQIYSGRQQYVSMGFNSKCSEIEKQGGWSFIPQLREQCL